MTNFDVICVKVMILHCKRPALTSQFDVSKLQKQIQSVIQNSFGSVCQLLPVSVNCMRDSKPQRCVQQHRSFEVSQNPTNPKST